jgi:hypothetical protein
MSSRSRTATSPLRDLALNIGKSSLTVADECLRFRYEESPELLARMVSRGEMDYAEVLATVHDLLDGRITVPEARAMLVPDVLSSLARLMAGLMTPAQDFRDAADISQAVRMLGEGIRLSRDAPRIDGQANLTLGRYEYVARVLEDDLDEDTRWILTAELAHPANGRPGATEDAWLDAFNQRFVDQGLLPVRLADGPGAAFDRLAVDVPDALVVDDPESPVVTVIMSTFKPDHSFPTAVASLVAQTWRNLEILVVDDCSPPEFDHLLESVTATDPRIRLVKMPVNGGTYKIRNHAIAQCRGSFVTFQDSDDWAHPERIARQVKPLLGPTNLVATHARSLRVNDDLTTLKVGYNSFRRAAASLMFRKDIVIRALGGFDETRKAADTEFGHRITTVFGEDANDNLLEVLVMTQLTEGSLSRAEFAFGWHHPARVAFSQAYQYWHREIAAGRASARLEPGAPRQYPAPERFLTGRDAPAASPDVMWVSDWRGQLGRYVGASALIEAVARSGPSVMVAQAAAVRHSDRDRDRLPLGDDIMRLQADGLTKFAIWAEPAHSRLLLVGDPELLALTRPPEYVGLTCGRLVIIAGHPPVAPSGDWWTYDPASVEHNAKRMFGVEPAWLPAHSGIADELRACGATGTILPPHQLRAVPTVRPRPYTGYRGGSRLIVGTTALELPRRDRPSWASLRRLLPQDDNYDVRLRADPDIVTAVLKHRRVPPGWLVMDESAPLFDFLRQLDVFVAVPSQSWGPELPWAAVAALAEGAVVVIDPAYQPHLRGAAVYASAVDIHDELKALAADPGRVTEYRERGYAFCREVLSEDAAVDLVHQLAGLERRNT